MEEQENALIAYMEEHSSFASLQFLGRNGVHQRKDQWTRLATMLNEVGLPKTKDAWIRYWTTLKSKSRAYNAQKIANLKKTGNCTNHEPFLINAKFERILNILGRKHCNGLEIIPELGLKQNLKRKDISMAYPGQLKKVPRCDQVSCSYSSVSSPIVEASHLTVIQNQKIQNNKEKIINVIKEISDNLKKLNH